MQQTFGLPRHAMIYGHPKSFQGGLPVEAAEDAGKVLLDRLTGPGNGESGRVAMDEGW